MVTSRTRARIGALLTIATLWMVGAALDLALTPLADPTATAQAAGAGAKQRAKSNPCNPCAGKAAPAANRDNPCNPCAAPTAATAKSNPCNPCAGRAAPAANRDNPCNPCAGPTAAAAKSNPCNPCAGRAAAATNWDNPCNPCNSGRSAAIGDNPCNPCGAGGTDNPCNPCGGGSGGIMAGGRIEWGNDYRSYNKVSSFKLSADHGNRLVVSYVFPEGAVKTFRHNAALARARKTAGFRSYPVGTVIVAESWDRDPGGAPGMAGPVFLMRKEKTGYDPSGANWRYGFALPDFSRVREGKDGRVAYCKSCHSAVQRGDFIHPPAP